MSTPERRAYRDAWRIREERDDDSPALLLEKLQAHRASPAWLEPNGDGHKWLFGCWARGVAPRALALDAAKEMGGLIPRVARPLRQVFRNLR